MSPLGGGMEINMNVSRTSRSIKNLLSGFLSRFIIIILGMVVRTVFIKSLGNSYLSVNGLYSNILSMLSLAEMGFGTAMVYSMYKPLAENDLSKLSLLMNFYGRVYRIIGWIILGVGLSIIPFMDKIIKDPPELKHLTLYYVMFLLNTVLSYWAFSYKRSMLTADQKEYVCTNYRSVFYIIKSIVQIICLVLFENYIVYLGVQLIATLGENIAISFYADRAYPVLKEKPSSRLAKEEIRKIANDVKALFLSRVAHIVLNSTDNIIISAFVGLSWVGLLSNYTLIVDSITGVLCQITSAISASLGNFFAIKDQEESYGLFKKVEFMNSWIYAFCSICLLMLLNPFISLWIGEEYTLQGRVVLAIVLNFYMQGYINTLWVFRSTMGLFTQGWYRPVIVTVLNIVLSIALGKYWGLFGVLIATTISRGLVNAWFDPWIIYKYGFNKSIKPFVITYLHRLLQFILITMIVGLIRYMAFGNVQNIVSFIGLMILTMLVFWVVFWGVNRKSEEFLYFESFAFKIIGNLRKH